MQGPYDGDHTEANAFLSVEAATEIGGISISPAEVYASQVMATLNHFGIELSEQGLTRLIECYNLDNAE